MTESKPILLDISDGVATITFNRPQAKNSLDVVALTELFTAFGSCEDRSDVGVVVLTGAGDAFCAGVNLKGYSLDNRDELRADRCRWTCDGNRRRAAPLSARAV